MSARRALRLLAVVALLCACMASWTGVLGLGFESDREVEQRTMLCPSGFITGLKVKHGRDPKDDVDTYDFQLQCGRRWTAWSGLMFKGLKEEKSFECPMKMHMTGIEVTKGRREWGDVDTYDFKLQCSGVWQDYMGLGMSNSKERAGRECPAGTMAWGWKVYRGFVKKGDKDYYEFDLNCKPAADASAAVRKSPSPREIGLSPNVFLWSPKDVGVWLGALGLGEYAPAFVENRLQGDVVFLLLESHLRDVGMSKVGDRLYFMEELTQLHDTTNAWAKALGTPLTSIRTLPNLYKVGLPSEVVSWSVKEVAKWVEALGLAEWVGVFTQHRIQGDVMFSLTEQALKEMGVSRIGDRLYIVDCLQSLYEELTSWKKKHQSIQARSRAAAPRGQARTYPPARPACLCEMAAYDPNRSWVGGLYGAISTNAGTMWARLLRASRPLVARGRVLDRSPITDSPRLTSRRRWTPHACWAMAARRPRQQRRLLHGEDTGRRRAAPVTAEAALPVPAMALRAVARLRVMAPRAAAVVAQEAAGLRRCCSSFYSRDLACRRCWRSPNPGPTWP